MVCICTRCQCGHCEVMPSAHECGCCCDLDCVTEKKDESSTSIDCFTDYEGFQPICLDVWVLQTAYFTFRSKIIMGILLQRKLPMSEPLYSQIHWHFNILVSNAPLGYHCLPED